jgi:hypothetical protein
MQVQVVSILFPLEKGDERRERREKREEREERTQVSIWNAFGVREEMRTAHKTQHITQTDSLCKEKRKR